MCNTLPATNNLAARMAAMNQDYLFDGSIRRHAANLFIARPGTICILCIINYVTRSDLIKLCNGAASVVIVVTNHGRVF